MLVLYKHIVGGFLDLVLDKQLILL
jgi:hypothetical protein